jgi:predicted Rossmann-fold nucleotide-binding protein
MRALAQALAKRGRGCGLLNVNGYYDALAAFLDHAVAQGFLTSEHRRILTVASDPAELLDLLAAFEPPTVGKWLEREQS